MLTGTPTEATLATVGEAAQDGTATFKYFTTDLTTTQRGIRLDTGSIRELLEQCARHGAVAMVHAEDDDLIKHMEAKLRREGRTELRNVHLVHTNAGEELAVRESGAARARRGRGALRRPRLLGSGRATRSPRCALRASLSSARRSTTACASRSTTTTEPDGAKYHIGMGLRPKEDCAALWDGLVDGRLSTLATDEYTTSYAVKMAGTDIESTPGGHVGIETRGHHRLLGGRRQAAGCPCAASSTSSRRTRRASPACTRARASSPPARDADLVLWDPDARFTITMDDLHHDGDYSPWEGWEIAGRPVTTILRGRVVVDRGRLVADRPDGRFVKRRVEPDVLSGPVV